MRKRLWTGLIAVALALGNLQAFAQPDPNQKRRDSLLVLYEARWTETICGFHFDDVEKAKLADATIFIEGRLNVTPAQKSEIDARAKAFIERVKADRNCEADGEFAKIVRKMIADLPDPEPPKSVPPPPKQP